MSKNKIIPLVSLLLIAVLIGCGNQSDSNGEPSLNETGVEKEKPQVDLASFEPAVVNDVRLVDEISTQYIFDLYELKNKYLDSMRFHQDTIARTNAETKEQYVAKANDGKINTSLYLEKLQVLHTKAQGIADMQAKQLIEGALNTHISINTSMLEGYDKYLAIVDAGEFEKLQAMQADFRGELSNKGNFFLISGIQLAFARKSVGLGYGIKASRFPDSPEFYDDPLGEAKASISMDKYENSYKPNSYTLFLKFAGKNRTSIVTDLYNGVEQKKAGVEFVGEERKLAENLSLMLRNVNNHGWTYTGAAISVLTEVSNNQALVNKLTQMSAVVGAMFEVVDTDIKLELNNPKYADAKTILAIIKGTDVDKANAKGDEVPLSPFPGAYAYAKAYQVTKLRDLKVAYGRLDGQWLKMEMKFYKEPLLSSEVVFQKAANSKLMSSAGKEVCHFIGDDSPYDCYRNFIKEYHLDVPPVTYHLNYTDYSLRDGRIWVKVNFMGQPLWVSNPENYFTLKDRLYWSIGTTEFRTNEYQRWNHKPGLELQSEAGVKSEIKLDAELAKDKNLRIQIVDEIIWVGDKAYIRVNVVKKLSQDEWCRQRAKPEIVMSGYIELFNDQGEINISMVPLDSGECD